MKKIDQIREQYDLITEKEEAETRKLTSLVRAGLFDPKKLPMLKRALNKDPKDMTPAERKILIELLDSLMAEVLQSQQVYSKVKQNVMMKEETIEEAKTFDGYYSKYDPRYTKMPTDREIPTIIILKRKAIRIYPDNQKVALYYSQALDKYVTIPFGTFGDGPMNEEVTIGSDDDDDKEDYGYQMKKSYTKYKNPEDHKKIIKKQSEIDDMKRKLASGHYREGQSTRTAKQNIAGHENALQKLKQKAPQEKVTKTVAGGDPSKLSKGNFKKLMKGISKDKDMSFATKLGTKFGLRARRVVDKTLAAGSDKLNHAFEESDIKSKFYAKRKQQVDEGAAVLALPAVAGAAAGSTIAAPLAAALGVGVASKLAYDELKKGQKIRKAGEIAGKEIAAKTPVDIEKSLPAKPDYQKATELPNELKVKLAIVDKTRTKDDNVSKSIALPEPAKGITPPAVAPKATAAAGNIPKDVEAAREVARGAALAQTKATSGKKTDAQVQTNVETDKGKKDDEDSKGRPKGLGGYEPPSFEVEKKYTPPKDFGLQVKTSGPKGDVRTSVQTRDTSLYRKSLQNEESNTTFNIVKSYRKPKPFELSGKIKLSDTKGNVRTSVDVRDTIQYRKSLQQNESVLNTLYSINENEEKAIEIANESVVINNTVAKKIIGLYESVNRSNKEKIETMLNESVDSFKKIASFAARQ